MTTDVRVHVRRAAGLERQKAGAPRRRAATLDDGRLPRASRQGHKVGHNPLRAKEPVTSIDAASTNLQCQRHPVPWLSQEPTFLTCFRDEAVETPS
ncbi:MAG: hypothetical protein AMXMBFR59_15680 [Rhodanobacteraceae bacterium]